MRRMQLNPEEYAYLDRTRRTNRSHVAERCHDVLLSAAGLSGPQIAQRLARWEGEKGHRAWPGQAPEYHPLWGTASQHPEDVLETGTTALKNLLPVVLAGIVIYALCSPRLGVAIAQPRMSHGAFYLLAGVTLGFFDGFIGAGAGMLWTMAFVVGIGFNLTKATAYTKVMNATSNVAAFTLFLGYGSVWLAAGLVMALGQVAGGVLGVYVVIKKGAGWVRPLYLTVVILLLLKLLYERFAWAWLKS